MSIHQSARGVAEGVIHVWVNPPSTPVPIVGATARFGWHTAWFSTSVTSFVLCAA